MPVFTPNTNGLFSIPDSLYHDAYAAPEVSRSMLVDMMRYSPQHLKALMEGTRVKVVTEAMMIGSLVDKALLEPERFKEGLSHWIRPAEIDLRSKEGIAWKKDHPILPAIPLTTTSHTKVSAADIQGMINSVLNHKIGRRIIETSVKQESAFAKHGDTGLMRKCRPDARFTDNGMHPCLGDLKATFLGGGATASLSTHCARMGWHIQHCWYQDIYTDLTGERPFFVFLLVERKPPYAVRVFQIHEDGVRVAREKCKRALDIYAQCKATDVWPAYPEEIETIYLPQWELALEPIDLT